MDSLPSLLRHLFAGRVIVVFASAKDRKPTAVGSRLHTNFKLNTGGEYLALFNADSPRAAVTEFPTDHQLANIPAIILGHGELPILFLHGRMRTRMVFH